MRIVSIVICVALIVLMIPSAHASGYTNVLAFALADDGVSVYNDIGYKANTRWSTSGQSESTQNGTYLSGWIPVSGGSVIRLKNVDMMQSSSVTVVFLTNSIGKTLTSANASSIGTYYSGLWDENGNLIQFTIPTNSSYTYIRIQCSGFSSDSIITINEEIKDIPVTAPTDPVDTEPRVTDPPATVPPASDPTPALDTAANPGSVMGLFGVAVAACSAWFVALMDGTGYGGIFLAMIFLMLAYRFLLKPVFGSGGSDKAKKKSEDK